MLSISNTRQIERTSSRSENSDNQIEKNKTKQQKKDERYRNSKAGQAARKEYKESGREKAASSRYRKSEHGKAIRHAYSSRPENQEKHRLNMQVLRSAKKLAGGNDQYSALSKENQAALRVQARATILGSNTTLGDIDEETFNLDTLDNFIIPSHEREAFFRDFSLELSQEEDGQRINNNLDTFQPAYTSTTQSLIDHFTEKHTLSYPQISMLIENLSDEEVTEMAESLDFDQLAGALLFMNERQSNLVYQKNNALAL